MQKIKKRRATVIYVNENGILLTRISNEPWILPGGHAENNEPRIIAAIRELYEETSLIAIDVKYLFDFESTHFFHKVFLINAIGYPKPGSEVTQIKYYKDSYSLSFTEINKSSLQIIYKFKLISSF